MQHFLETERLALCPLTSSDLDLLHRTFTHPFVRKYLWDDEIISPEQTAEILRKNEQHFAEDKWGLWQIIVKEDKASAGFAGLWSFFEEPQPQLLYGLLPAKTKQGYATEAAQAVIHYVLNELQFEYITAACDTPHTASKKVCARLKMPQVAEKEINGKPTTFYRLNKQDAQQ